MIKGKSLFEAKAGLLMYISCPECDTKFVVSAEQIGPGGRRVKCSKCSHIWHQTPHSNVKIEPLLTAQPVQDVQLGSGVNLPALLPIRIPLYLYSLPFLLISLIVVMLTMMFPDRLGLDTSLSQKALSVKDIKVENNKDLGKIVVSYKILNSSDAPEKMKLIRIRLFDENHRLLKSHIVDHSNVELAAKQYVLIKTEFVPAPPSTAHLDIMIGNKLDFILR